MGKKLKKNVPMLRFPEFKGSWKILTIEEIASISSGGTPSRAEPTYWNGDIPWITTSETSQSEIFDSLEKITQKGLENSSAKIFPKNTILMAMYGQGKTRGQVSLLRINAATSQNFAAITLKKAYCPEFVYCFLYQQYEHLRSLSNGNSHQNLSSGLIKSYGVPITSLAEQEKIASFLGAVDNRLTQLRRKHELLQTYKRGVMQKIFSQQIRFKCDDGQPFPDWEEITLGKVSSFVNGKAHENDVVDNGRFVIVNSKFISTDGTVLKFSDKQLLPLFKNDIVMVMSDVPNGKALAKCFYIQEDNRFTLNQRICCLRTQKVDSKYLFYFINRNEYFLSFDSGVSQTNLRKEDVLSCPILQPSLLESEKIAGFLIALDQKIEAIAQQIKLTEQFKKGLLQKMFV
jgi:type I restriction enzyme S subunit